MTPWEVIELALAHKRPARNLQWLADEIGVSIQVVSNWKARRVPAKRYREIAAALGISLDQLEGIEPLPWGGRIGDPDSDLSDEAHQVAAEIDQLPPKQRDWVLMAVRNALDLARESITVVENRPAPVRRKGAA